MAALAERDRARRGAAQRRAADERGRVPCDRAGRCRRHRCAPMSRRRRRGASEGAQSGPSCRCSLLAIAVGGGGERGVRGAALATCARRWPRPAQADACAASRRRLHPARLCRSGSRRRRGARPIHAALRGRMPLRIAGHHGLIPCVRDPFPGTLRPTEQGAAIVREIAGAIPPDTLCVSHDFAAVLAAKPGTPREINWIGELQAFDGGSADRPLRAQRLRPQRTSSSSRCGATTTSRSASRRMMPRRSSALTARDAVSRVVATCSARSARIGQGRMLRSASAAPGAAARHGPARPRTRRHARTSATWSAAADRPCLEQSEADAAMLLGEQRQHAAFEQEGGDLLDRDHVGIVGRRIRRADHAEKVARPIFVEQHRPGRRANRRWHGRGPSRRRRASRSGRPAARWWPGIRNRAACRGTRSARPGRANNRRRRTISGRYRHSPMRLRHCRPSRP